MTAPLLLGRLSREELTPRPAELRARLQCPPGRLPPALLARCEGALREALDCRWAARRVCLAEELPALPPDFLAGQLKGCRHAFVLAVTLGHGVDRLLARLSLLSQTEYLLADGIASALAEAACGEVDARLSAGLSCLPRFSPGYGALPLSLQPSLLSLLDAGRQLGITLSSSLLMSPSKSITAILGIRELH